MVCVIIRNIKGMGRYFTALLTKEEFWERGRGISTRNCLPHVVILQNNNKNQTKQYHIFVINQSHTSYLLGITIIISSW